MLQLLEFAQEHHGTLVERAEVEALAALSVESASLDDASLSEMLHGAVAKGIPAVVR